MTFSLRGNSIPTDGSGRVLITAINPTVDNDEDALICRSETNGFATPAGDWFLHPTEMSTDSGDPNDNSDTGDRILIPDPRGWTRNRDLDSSHRLVGLRRRGSPTAEEGVFTCTIAGDINTPGYLGIYYPSEFSDVFQRGSGVRLCASHSH